MSEIRRSRFAPSDWGYLLVFPSPSAAIAGRPDLDADVAVGANLADQLLLPITQSAGSRSPTVEPTAHFRTNLDVPAHFFDLELIAELAGGEVVPVDCAAADPRRAPVGSR